MPVTLSVSATTATSVTFGFAGMPGAGTLELQMSARADFQFCVAPIIVGIGLATPLTLGGLNQAATYYARVRGRVAGVAEEWSNTVGFRTALNAAPSIAPQAVMIHPTLLVVPVPILAWLTHNQVAGFPVENLAIDAPVAWRGQGLNPYVGVNIAPEPVDTFCLLNTNLPEAATMTIKGGNTISVAQYTYGPVPFRASANLGGRSGYHGLFRLPAPLSYPFWRVIIGVGGEGLPGDLIHAEHLIVGLNRTSKNHSVEKVEQPIDLGTLDRDRSGNPQRSRGLRMRRVEFDISVMSEAQYETLYADLGERVGSTDPVLVAPNSRTGAFLHDRLLYGALTASRTTNPASPVFTKSFTIESLV